jgi:hypothetical protein
MIKLFHLKFKADKGSSDEETKAFVCTTHPFIKILFNDYQGSLEIIKENSYKSSYEPNGQGLCYITTDIYNNPKTHKEFQEIIDNNINEIANKLQTHLININIYANFFNDIKSSLEVHNILE